MTPIRLVTLVLAALQIAACAALGTDRDEAPPEPLSAPAPVPATPPQLRDPPQERSETPAIVDTRLAALSLSIGSLDQAFQPEQRDYTSTQGFLVSAVAVTARSSDPAAMIAIGEAAAQPGRIRLTLPLAIGDNTWPIVVTGADGEARETYRLTVRRAGSDTLAERRYLKASNADRNDLFGYALAADSDRLAIGAYLEASYAGGVDGDPQDNSAEGSGAVYLFARHGDDWVQQAYIKGLANGSGQQFGRALALSGDTLAVGAPFDGHGGSGIDPAPAGESSPDSGAVHIFRFRDGVWEREAYIKAGDAESGALFGYSVALRGDVLAVGAYLEDAALEEPGGALTDSGAVHVFQRRDGVWHPAGHLLPSQPQRGAGFGYSIALSTDTLAVGAHLEAGSGAVHLFGRDGERWTQGPVLRAPAPGSNDLFGSALALDGETLAVGAHLADGAHENGGAVYIYRRRSGVWSEPVRLEPTPGGAEHRFGRSVALANDILAAGAYLEDGGGTGVRRSAEPGAVRAAESGAVYVYTRSGDDWTQHAYIKAGNADAGDMFGYAVAVSGDTLIAGAPTEAAAGPDPSDNAVAGAGAVYVFR